MLAGRLNVGAMHDAADVVHRCGPFRLLIKEEDGKRQPLAFLRDPHRELKDNGRVFAAATAHDDVRELIEKEIDPLQRGVEDVLTGEDLHFTQIIPSISRMTMTRTSISSCDVFTIPLVHFTVVSP